MADAHVGKTNYIRRARKRARSITLTVGWLITMSCFLANHGHAQETTWRTMLIMPGKVSEPHAEFEHECDACHYSFEKRKQDALCLDCHDHAPIKKDIENKTGYHGRIMQEPGISCVQCHTEHKGRDHVIVAWDKQTFDHSQTDFELKGKHVALACENCHKQGKLHREADVECFGCHEKDDRHDGALGEQCGDCHDESGWEEQAFNHDDTDYPLEGEHEQVLCESCHPDERYEGTPTACVDCHKLNDIHRGSMDDKCEDCHAPQGWDQVSFDHDVDTDYPLEHRHEEVACHLCHDHRFDKDLENPRCFGCHRDDDVHTGRNGEQCEDCHSPRGWSDTGFDHAAETDFPLRGKHETVACNGCHLSGLDEELSMECIECHRVDDVHRGNLGENCADCHEPSGWQKKSIFDHSATKLPLIGSHELLACEDCHLSAQFEELDSACVDCHRQDDYHDGSLGMDCQRCHNPNAWELWLFDHDEETEFKLEGSHQNLACDFCHEGEAELSTELELEKDCRYCHAQDDVHEGEFGRDCGRCHLTTSFDKLDKFARPENRSLN